MTFIHSVVRSGLRSMGADASVFLDFAKMTPLPMDATRSLLKSANAVMDEFRADLFPAAQVRVST
jgi:hypothetical protein